jgi:hypothetical protein
MSQRIEGLVVSAAAVSRRGAKWDLVLFLCPWRHDGGTVQRKQLRLLVPMDKESASRAISRWEGKGVALQLERLQLPSKKLPWGLAHGSPPLKSLRLDAEMQEVIEDQGKPRRVTNPVLGELELDRRFGWYQGKRGRAKSSYEVSIGTPDAEDAAAVAKAVGHGARVVQQLEAGLPSILDAIIRKTLDLYNSTWRQEGAVLTAAAFRKRLALESVVIDEERTTAFFDCDGLFTDHIIEVRMSPRGRITEICLSG